MPAAVVSVFLLALLDLRREEARALDDFTSEQSALARAFSAALAARIDGVAATLRAASAVDPGPALDQVLARSLAEQPALRELRVVGIDGDGNGELLVEQHRSGYAPLSDSPLLTAAARAMLTARTETSIAISGPLRRSEGSAERLRLLMLRQGHRATFLLLDTTGFFAGLALPAQSDSPPLRWLVLDDGRRWTELGASDDVHGWRVGEPSELSRAGEADLAALLAHMSSGESGAVLLSRASSDALGLGARRAVAGFAPVDLHDGPRWSVAVVTSARRVRDRARLAGWRLAISTGLASLLVALFGLIVAKQERRALELAKALELAAATAALRERSEKLIIRAEKLGTVGTLAAGVAHEVGTPLGIISGRAEQLLTQVPEGAPGDATRKGLTSILAQVDKVSLILRQLLDFARVRPIDADAVTPALALSHAASLLEHRFRQAKVTLTVDAPATLPLVAADPGQLEQVLVNLLINACDAHPHTVVARARLDHDRMAFEIIDDGEGIPTDQLAAVLDPFFTTKKRGQGTGLGLTIAADIVRNHGGQLEIDSRVTAPSGTTLRIFLPLSAAATVSPTKKETP